MWVWGLWWKTKDCGGSEDCTECRCGCGDCGREIDVGVGIKQRGRCKAWGLRQRGRCGSGNCGEGSVREWGLWWRG